MPVYDHAYRRFEGKRQSRLACWLAIPKFAYLDFMTWKSFIILLTASWVPFLVFMLIMYTLVNPDILEMLRVPAQMRLPIDAGFFKIILGCQLYFCLSFAFLLGSGIMSRDFEHRAFVLFFSKPISRLEYFLGKFTILMIIFLFVTAFQALLLYGFQLAVSPPESPWRFNFWQDYAWIPVQIVAYSLIIGVTINLMIIACSCLSSKSFFAGAIFAVMNVGLWMMSAIIKGISHNENYIAISPIRALDYIGYHIFRVEGPEVSAQALWTCLAICWAVSALIIKVRLDQAARRGR